MTYEITTPPTVFLGRWIKALNSKPENSQTKSNTTVYLLQIVVGAPTTIDGVQITNGGTINGNVRVGLYGNSPTIDYPEGSTLYAQSAATAQSGTNLPQFIPFTEAVSIPAGQYWIAFATSSATATFILSGYFNLGVGWAEEFSQAFGALPNPCPSTVAGGSGYPYLAARVQL